ncbi:hypothetical protein CAOG_05819 [Capsaspora owczarzaki ATCC 30864]|uniref:Cytochrome c oxidase assembly protein COX16, mitochondrial n=1 Tax=Capsaspora owczarzaki (strain ATCC 30864) TaxID=595528 RepID=A0A0D2WST3_CAPO3|nr:hypothetical protein CAOG_05819 [Capsaspora owczarzaki ATCC 30864]KJE95365.1 hypothetical protein CAOG_005819 [Capsaspora owczarzaki ATCC 30864]|eukprot:XP_004345409.1 hypothetical protein CAOG_05819 [Capsaspora owczarzaki ATCC 30864]
MEPRLRWLSTRAATVAASASPPPPLQRPPPRTTANTGSRVTGSAASASASSSSSSSSSSWFGAVSGFARRNATYIRIGAPFLLLVVGSSVGMSYIADAAVEYRDYKNHRMDRDEALAFHNIKKRPFSIEDEFMRMVQGMDIEHWENKRLPRSDGDAQAPPSESK